MRNPVLYPQYPQFERIINTPGIIFANKVKERLKKCSFILIYVFCFTFLYGVLQYETLRTNGLT